MRDSPRIPRALPKATFLFTVDLELAWGLAHSAHSSNLQRLEQDATHGRQAVLTLLQILAEYRVPATWATVGHLFLERCSKDGLAYHHHMPRAKADWYQVDPGSDIRRAPLFYGKDIVDKIMDSVVPHEIGHHSFSHVLFSECTPEVAEAEVLEGQRLAKGLGIALRSFVFPHNRVGHVDILKKHGFKMYRGRNLLHSYGGIPGWAVGGALDLLFAPPCYPALTSGIWELPSSLYFSESRYPFTLVPRARLGVLRAIRAKQVFHVFLHDWNLVTDPSLSNKLSRLLAFVARQREKGVLETTTMGGLADYLDGAT